MACYYYYSVFPPLLVPRLLYHDTRLLLLNKHGMFILSCLLHYLCLQSKDCLFSWCKKPSAMPTLLDLLTEQLSTNNTHALASSSLAAMHLKTLQMQSGDPNNGNLRIKLTYSFLCLSE